MWWIDEEQFRTETHRGAMVTRTQAGARAGNHHKHTHTMNASPPQRSGFCSAKAAPEEILVLVWGGLE